MYQLGKGVLVGLAITAAMLVIYQFIYLVWGVLNTLSDEVIFGGFSLMLLTAWVAYVRWAWSVLRRGRKARRESKTHLVELRGVALRAEHQAPPVDMEALEHSVQHWSTRGDAPGSLAGSAIGLELIDEYLEGDM